MSFPWLDAKPTKFTSALRTRHMVAALILFDLLVAMWACFGICKYPIQIFALIAELVNPEVSQLANGWVVLFFAAEDAYFATAITSCPFLNYRFNEENLLTRSIATVFELRITIGPKSQKVSPVLREVGASQKLREG